MSDASAEPVCSCAPFLHTFAHETAGEARTRHSLRPLIGGYGKFDSKPRANRAARSRSCAILRAGPNSPAPATPRKTASPYDPSSARLNALKKTGDARPPDMEDALPVRYYDWITHFGRRTPDKIAVIDLASERRLSYAQLDARISRLATHLRDQLKVAARRPGRGAGAEHDGYAGSAVRLLPAGRRVPAAKYPPHGPRVAIHRRAMRHRR